MVEDFDSDLSLQQRIDDVVGISEKMCPDNNTASMVGPQPQLICWLVSPEHLALAEAWNSAVAEGLHEVVEEVSAH